MIRLKYYYPMAEYSESGILKDTKNIQNEKFGGNQVRCMQGYLTLQRAIFKFINRLWNSLPVV